MLVFPFPAHLILGLPVASWLLFEDWGRAARLNGISIPRGGSPGLAHFVDQARAGTPVGRT